MKNLTTLIIVTLFAVGFSSSAWSSVAGRSYCYKGCPVKCIEDMNPRYQSQCPSNCFYRYPPHPRHVDWACVDFCLGPTRSLNYCENACSN